jgi:hypothetical protein
VVCTQRPEPTCKYKFLFFKEEAKKKASKLLYVLLALLLAASFGVLGCGGDDDGNKDNDPPPPFPTGGDTYTAPSGYTWAWFPYTADQVSMPNYVTTVNIHAGNGFEGITGKGGKIAIRKIILTKSAVADSKEIMDFSTKTLATTTGFEDYGMMAKVVGSDYVHSSAGEAYGHGEGFGDPDLISYSYVGFCIKTDGTAKADLGDVRAELGGSYPNYPANGFPQVVQAFANMAMVK